MRAPAMPVAIAERALSAQPAGIAGYAERLTAALEELSPEERKALLEGANLRLVSATPLSALDKDAVQNAVAQFDMRPSAETDPPIIAGLELRSESGAIRNSRASHQAGRPIRETSSTCTHDFSNGPRRCPPRRGADP